MKLNTAPFFLKKMMVEGKMLVCSMLQNKLKQIKYLLFDRIPLSDIQNSLFPGAASHGLRFFSAASVTIKPEW